MPICSLAPSPVTAGWGLGGGGGCQQSPGWTRLKEEGHFLKHLNSAVPEILSKLP